MKSSQRSGSSGAFGMGQGGFPDEARQVEGQGEDITQEGGLGSIGQAETRHALLSCLRDWLALRASA